MAAGNSGSRATSLASVFWGGARSCPRADPSTGRMCFLSSRVVGGQGETVCWSRERLVSLRFSMLRAISLASVFCGGARSCPLVDPSASRMCLPGSRGLVRQGETGRGSDCGGLSFPFAFPLLPGLLLGDGPVQGPAWLYVCPGYPRPDTSSNAWIFCVVLPGVLLRAGSVRAACEGALTTHLHVAFLLLPHPMPLAGAGWPGLAFHGPSFLPLLASLVGWVVPGTMEGGKT